MQSLVAGGSSPRIIFLVSCPSSHATKVASPASMAAAAVASMERSASPSPLTSASGDARGTSTEPQIRQQRSPLQPQGPSSSDPGARLRQEGFGGLHVVVDTGGGRKNLRRSTHTSTVSSRFGFGSSVPACHCVHVASTTAGKSLTLAGFEDWTLSVYVRSLTPLHACSVALCALCCLCCVHGLTSSRG